MKIYSGDKLAESVKIGDPLKIIVNIDKQDMYGLRVTDCSVRDGVGIGEQRLLDHNGCPFDQDVSKKPSMCISNLSNNAKIFSFADCRSIRLRWWSNKGNCAVSSSQVSLHHLRILSMQHSIVHADRRQMSQITDMW